jgi:pimeloyl-ACP methyl ester carboxylesterase
VLIHGRPDRDQLDGNAGRAQGLGGVFRRAGLHRLHDRPAHARPLGGAPIRWPDAVTVANEEWQFTASESAEGTWPQAKKHTQWPGEGPNKGKKGDPIFDAFYATQVETVISNVETQKRNQDAGAALLDKIGPAIVLTHSQSGSFGWLIADARPQRVKAIVAIEPAGAAVRSDHQRQRQGAALGADRHCDHL